MEQFSLINFLTMSIPEEFLLSFFVWTILGKKDTVKFRYVIFTTLITAMAFISVQFLTNWDLSLSAVLNLAIFAVIIFFTYKLSIFESVISALLSMVIYILIQSVTINIGMLILNKSNGMDIVPYEIRILLFIPVFIIHCLISLILFKNNIKILNFKKKKSSIYYLSRIRFIVLQLTFTFLIIFLNFRLYWNNKNLFSSSNDKILIIMNLVLIVFFTVLILISVFKLGKDIQLEEEQKRSFDGREFLQNIDYLCKLMENKDYVEAERMLESIKSDVNTGLLSNSGTNRG
ncbi:MAG TPA: hypothetical protein VIO64_14195 [Pseudobacteroides sp.]|uniref:hypothetical protein n=1 Tax=Pseudobacteroides sp. TaxID=1968840 RepID=UPI002F95498B